MSSRSTTAYPEVEDDTANQLQPLYHVILLNDEDHTYDYVVEMLQKIFGFSESKAFSHAVEVDTKGTTILVTCELEEAERKRDFIHTYGPDWRLPRSLGSMAAVVEPAAGEITEAPPTPCTFSILGAALHYPTPPHEFLNF